MWIGLNNLILLEFIMINEKYQTIKKTNLVCSVKTNLSICSQTFWKVRLFTYGQLRILNKKDRVWQRLPFVILRPRLQCCNWQISLKFDKHQESVSGKQPFYEVFVNCNLCFEGIRTITANCNTRTTVRSALRLRWQLHRHEQAPD